MECVDTLLQRSQLRGEPMQAAAEQRHGEPALPPPSEREGLARHDRAFSMPPRPASMSSSEEESDHGEASGEDSEEEEMEGVLYAALVRELHTGTPGHISASWRRQRNSLADIVSHMLDCQRSARSPAVCRMRSAPGEDD